MTVLPYYLIFLVPFSVVLGYQLGGLCTFLTPVFVFGFVPVLDLLIGAFTENPTPEEEKALKEKSSFKIITILCAPLQAAMVLWGAYVISLSTLAPLEVAGFVFSMGVSSGVMGINVSHELQHRVNLKLEPLLARVMLWTVMYMHWSIEHIAGHHKNVATPEDPASARLGESFYAFWPRTVFGGIRSAWNIEITRLSKKGLGVLSLKNRMLIYLMSEVALGAVFLIAFGVPALAFYVIQGVVAFSLLEIVNYVQHYGLLRNRIDENRYEPVSLLHSWNSSNWLTNRFLFNLQRHSDHHYKPDKRYQILRHFNESPQLPTGYAGMILLATIPPLWRKIMDHRVNEHRLAMRKTENIHL